MRKSTKITFAAAAACLIAAGGVAFTEANIVPTEIAGYGTNTVTGVTATNIAYNVNATDASRLDSIVFTTTQDVSADHTALLTINDPVTPAGTRYSCDESVPNVITCDTTGGGGQLIDPITSVGLTVTHD